MVESSRGNDLATDTDRRLCMPVVEAIHIEGYPLYPGDGDGNGLSHSFESGVTVIAGINGQGKTTLLNILYRVLVGPWDQSKADYKNPGKKQHKLTALNRFGYFSARIDRNADFATAKITIAFGDQKVTIKRTLGPKLEIKELWHNKTQLHGAGEDEWTELILELSGMASSYDFHFVVRNFLFFLEDKVPLLWNPYGQFEVLRIIFLQRDLAAQCANLHDEILTLDSIYRNEHWHLSQEVERLQELKATYGDDETIKNLIDNLATTETRYQALGARIEDLEGTTTFILKALDNTESELFRVEVELHDSYDELEKVENQFFHSRLPNSIATAEIIFSDILTNRPCPVCKTVHHNSADRVRRLLTNGQCPACESHFGLESTGDNISSFDSEKLRRLENKVKDLREMIRDKTAHRSDLRRELQNNHIELKAARTEILTLEVALNKVRGAQNEYPQEVAALQASIEKLTAADLGRKEILKAKRIAYESALSDAANKIELVAQSICDEFKKYADDFLLESASLFFEMHERTVGESGQRLAFPNFIVKLTSAGGVNQTSRPDSDQVSESQREFVDLAFRMALLNVAISKHGPAMLVIETPEASLDAVFIERAGRMIRTFASVNPNNKVIATCNLNGEDMIKWLVGNGQNGGDVDRTEVDGRVINLLKKGRPTAGYLKEKAKYDLAFERAVYG